MSIEAFSRFAPTIKVAGSTRAVSAEDTLTRIRAVQSRVPITRVADLTPLDSLGLPVFAAVTPLARDLTTHLGKGATPADARASAMMEAIERVSAESVPTEPITASFEEIRDRAVDPRLFELPKDTAFSPTLACRWIPGVDLLAKRSVFIPVDLVQNPPEEGILRDADTNGLAAGNSLLEATIQGLAEVIERDAYSQLKYCSLFASPARTQSLIRTVRNDSLPERARAMIDRCEAVGVEVRVQDITSDIGIPIFRSWLCDYAYAQHGGEPVAFWGLGSHPDGAAAVMRSITEAVQARLATIQGSRDTYNETDASRRSGRVSGDVEQLAVDRVVSFADSLSFVSPDLAEDLAVMLEAVERAGVRHVVAVDLTRADLGVPVVRVRASGLSQFAVNMRRVGMRCHRHLL